MTLDRYSKHKVCKVINPLDKGHVPKFWCTECKSDHYYFEGTEASYDAFIQQELKRKSKNYLLRGNNAN